MVIVRVVSKIFCINPSVCECDIFFVWVHNTYLFDVDLYVENCLFFSVSECCWWEVDFEGKEWMVGGWINFEWSVCIRYDRKTYNLANNNLAHRDNFFLIYCDYCTDYKTILLTLLNIYQTKKINVHDHNNFTLE